MFNKIVSWLKPVSEPVAMPVKKVSNWRTFVEEQPAPVKGNDLYNQNLYVVYCKNGFMSVCRWDGEMFRNMCDTRRINQVHKWIELPDTMVPASTLLQ
jgi:hypothetical protein